MGTQVGRLVSPFVLACAAFLVVASCGGAGSDTTGSPDASLFDGFSPGFTQEAGAHVNSCAPKSCAELGYNCGLNTDGCGGTQDCGACAATQQCGVGGYSLCGDPSTTADGASVCTPKTCADLGYDCGVAADGCGSTVNCGSTVCAGNRVLWRRRVRQVRGELRHDPRWRADMHSRHVREPRLRLRPGGRRMWGHDRPLRHLLGDPHVRRGQAQCMREQRPLRGPLHAAGRLQWRRDDDSHRHRARGPSGGRHVLGAGEYDARSGPRGSRLHPANAADPVRSGSDQSAGPVPAMRRRRDRQPAGGDDHQLRRHVHAHQRAREQERGRRRQDPDRHPARKVAASVLGHGEQRLRSEHRPRPEHAVHRRRG